MDEDAEHVVVLAQDVVAAASDDDARAFIRSRLDDVALRMNSLSLMGISFDAGDTASEGVVSHHHGIQKGCCPAFFVPPFQRLPRSARSFFAAMAISCLSRRGTFNFFRQALADLVAAASVLTRNGNNR